MNRRHGMYGTPTYKSWAHMKERCANPDCRQFKWYGAKGISVCARWLQFNNFFTDMGVRPNGTTLDRIDSTRGYEPGNCRWATSKEQQRNHSNVILTEALAAEIRSKYKPRKIQQMALATEYGVSKGAIQNIILGETWN